MVAKQEGIGGPHSRLNFDAPPGGTVSSMEGGGKIHPGSIALVADERFVASDQLDERQQSDSTVRLLRHRAFCLRPLIFRGTI